VGLRQRAPYYAYRSAAGVARLMPASMAGLSARGVGTVFAAAMRDRRALVARHLQRVHGPELTGVALEAAVQRSFDSYARYWMEAFRLPSLSPAQIEASLSYEGIDHLLAARAEGRGVILVVPHLGNWDMGGAWMGARGFGLTAVAEPVEPPELFEWFASARRALGVRIIPLGPSSGTAVLRALRAGEVVALICDRSIGGTGGVPVTFFGEVTSLPGGPATLALRTGAPVLPVAVYFRGRRGHFGLVRPPLPVVRGGGLREDVTRLTQAVAVELEGLIRRAPEQWHLFQPNWPSDPGYHRSQREREE
jgi:phosphatidylinositol dimannoside acyltransferase